MATAAWNEAKARDGSPGNLGDRAAKLAVILAGESPANSEEVQSLL
jgi:hypothetical protein